MAVKQTEQGAVIFGTFEPSMSYRYLPGCAECGSKHPLACKPVPLNTEECPNCGAPAGQPGEEKTEYAAMRNTPAILYARFCLWAGRKLGALYERL